MALHDKPGLEVSDNAVLGDRLFMVPTQRPGRSHLIEPPARPTLAPPPLLDLAPLLDRLTQLEARVAALEQPWWIRLRTWVRHGWTARWGRQP